MVMMTIKKEGGEESRKRRSKKIKEERRDGIGKGEETLKRKWERS